MHWAAMFGLIDTGELLVNAKAEVNATTKSGETPLHLSAEKGKEKFVEFLVGKGADITIKDKSPAGLTAYDAAKKAGQKEVMAMLKPAGEGGCCVVM